MSPDVCHDDDFKVVVVGELEPVVAPATELKTTFFDSSNTATSSLKVRVYLDGLGRNAK